MVSPGKSIFSPVQLAVVAAMAVLMFLIFLATGNLIVEATGIPVSGGFAMFFLFTLVAVFTRLVLNRFGSATLMALVFGILGLSAPLLGPPGFFPKLIIIVVIGLMFDISFAILGKWEKTASVIAGLLHCYLGLGTIILIFELFLPPVALAAFLTLVPYFLAIIWIEGILGGLIGWWIYNRLRNRAVIQRIQGA